MENYFNFKDQINNSELKTIANGVKNGKLALFPTETVYGIGANGFDEEAVKKIYQAKGRSFKNPINLLVSSIKMVESVARDITNLEYRLMETFFPGPFTLILKKKQIVPDIVTAGSDTVGVRMPNNKIAKKLVEYAGVPIATPSANISGKPSSTNLEDILKDFSDKVDFIIDGGKTNLGIESTIVKVIDGIPHILRPGGITAEQIQKIAGNVSIDNIKLPSHELKHYQLNTKCILVYSQDTHQMIQKINELAKKEKKVVILSFSENVKSYTHYPVIDIGPKKDLNLVSKNLFTNLKVAENLKPNVILIEGIQKTGLGLAIMNHFLQVCGENYIEI